MNQKEIFTDDQILLTKEISTHCLHLRSNGMNIDEMVNEILQQVILSLNFFCANDEKILNQYKNWSHKK